MFKSIKQVFVKECHTWKHTALTEYKHMDASIFLKYILCNAGWNLGSDVCIENNINYSPNPNKIFPFYYEKLKILNLSVIKS